MVKLQASNLVIGVRFPLSAFQSTGARNLMKPGTACILLSNFEDAPHLRIIVKVNEVEKLAHVKSLSLYPENTLLFNIEAEPYQDVGNNGYKMELIDSSHLKQSCLWKSQDKSSSVQQLLLALVRACTD
jgi:hypothetical protein